MTICETCNKNESVGVACVPGVPYSAAYCGECLSHGASPFHILRGNISCCLSPKCFDDFGEYPWENGNVIIEEALDEPTYLDGKYMLMKEALRIKPITKQEILDFDAEYAKYCSEHIDNHELGEEEKF